MSFVRQCAITTKDNPFDPLDDFLNWFLFDVEKGYNSCGYLARVARCSEEFTDEENERIQEEAIDEIIKFDFRNVYRKLVRESD